MGRWVKIAFLAGAIVSKLSLDRSKFSASIKGVQKQTRALGGWVKKNSKQFKGMGLAIAAMGAAALLTFKKMVKQYVETGDMIHKMALRTGFAATTLSELAYAADISGADITMLEKAVKKMAKTLSDADRGMKTYIDAFEAIGFEVKDLMGLNPEEQFMKIGLAIADIEDPTLRAAAAVDIFGRAGTMLLPLFAEGAEGIAKLGKEGHTLGIIFDEEMAAKAAKLNDAQRALKGSVQGLSIAILNDLIPIITDVTKGFTDWFVDSRKDAKAWAGVLLGSFKLIAQGIQTMLLAFHNFQRAVFEGGELIVKAMRLQLELWMKSIGLFAKLSPIGSNIRKMYDGLADTLLNLQYIEKGYLEEQEKQNNIMTDLVFGFEKFFAVLDNVSDGLKTGKEDTKGLAGVMSNSLLPSISAVTEAWGGLAGDSKELTLAWQQDMSGMAENTQNFTSNLIVSLGGWAEGYEYTVERIKAANELLMESWGLTSESQLAFTELALSEFTSMEAGLKGFVDAILGTLEKWAIGQIIPKIMIALPFPLNLLATIGAITAIKGIFAGIRSMEEGGTVEHEGLHFLHRGEEVKSVEEVRGATGMTKTTGPFHTTVYLTIHAKYLDDRTINQAAAKIRHAVNRQGRRY